MNQPGNNIGSSHVFRFGIALWGSELVAWCLGVLDSRRTVRQTSMMSDAKNKALMQHAFE